MRRRIPNEKRKLIAEDISNGTPYNDIRSKYNISHSTISRTRIEFNIPNRDTPVPLIEYNYNNWQILLGSMMGDGSVNKRDNTFSETIILRYTFSLLY